MAAALLQLALGALASTPAARWGHGAVWLGSQNAMYVVGGQVDGSGTQVTNEVLVLSVSTPFPSRCEPDGQLNQTNPSFSVGSSDGLPPHASAAIGVSPDDSSIVVLGGMTSDCSSDSIGHTLDLSSGGWTGVTPSGMKRRRGAGMGWTSDSKLMVVGGLMDSYVCSSNSSTYNSEDLVSYPLSTSGPISTGVPSSLTGSSLGIANYAMTSSTNGSIYLMGGQDASGGLVSFDTIGKWDSTNGWQSHDTTGDVPSGRVGASLVAHPSLDLLVLHGGATDASSMTTDSATALLAFLNTTTWAWSTPSNLQPPSSSAVAYHSAIMTPSGVMVSAFGLGPSGSPRSDVYYLDMRDPSSSAWTWKSVWSAGMLDTITASNSTAAVSADKASEKKKDISIAVPVTIMCLLALPLTIWYVRRRVRIARKRRAARYFDMDDGFNPAAPSGGNGTSNSLFGRFRPRGTQYSFGRDANEKDTGVLADIFTQVKRISTRTSMRSAHSASSADAPEIQDKEMTQVQNRLGRSGSKLSSAIKWEEIDFGLGKLDESRLPRRASAAGSEASFSAGDDSHVLSPPTTGVASTQVYEAAPLQQQSQPLITIDGVEPVAVAESSVSGPIDVHSHPNQMLVPSLFVQPPTVPPTPSTLPYMMTTSGLEQDGLDWSQLESQLAERPAFRSISPTATLRSHAHQELPAQHGRDIPFVRSPSPMSMIHGHAPRSGAPQIAPMDFERSSSPTVALVASSPTSYEPALPFSSSSSSSMPPGARSVSRPLGRQLAGGPAGRRGSVPHAGLPGLRTTSRRSSDSVGMARRASNPVVGGGGVSPSGSPHISSVGSIRRGSQLRVVNVSEGDVFGDEHEEPGRAI